MNAHEIEYKENRLSMAIIAEDGGPLSHYRCFKRNHSHETIARLPHTACPTTNNTDLENNNCNPSQDDESHGCVESPAYCCAPGAKYVNFTRTLFLGI